MFHRQDRGWPVLRGGMAAILLCAASLSTAIAGASPAFPTSAAPRVGLARTLVEHFRPFALDRSIAEGYHVTTWLTARNGRCWPISRVDHYIRRAYWFECAAGGPTLFGDCIAGPPHKVACPEHNVKHIAVFRTRDVERDPSVASHRWRAAIEFVLRGGTACRSFSGTTFGVPAAAYICSGRGGAPSLYLLGRANTNHEPWTMLAGQPSASGKNQLSHVHREEIQQAWF
jgi:hypothetical protein